MDEVEEGSQQSLFVSPTASGVGFCGSGRVV